MINLSERLNKNEEGLEEKLLEALDIEGSIKYNLLNVLVEIDSIKIKGKNIPFEFSLLQLIFLDFTTYISFINLSFLCWLLADQVKIHAPD